MPGCHGFSFVVSTYLFTLSILSYSDTHHMYSLCTVYVISRSSVLSWSIYQQVPLLKPPKSSQVLLLVLLVTLAHKHLPYPTMDINLLRQILTGLQQHNIRFLVFSALAAPALTNTTPITPTPATSSLVPLALASTAWGPLA